MVLAPRRPRRACTSWQVYGKGCVMAVGVHPDLATTTGALSKNYLSEQEPWQRRGGGGSTHGAVVYRHEIHSPTGPLLTDS